MDLEIYLEQQNKEIERHKWLESEKAGRDLGEEAVIDWIMKYADRFSESFSRHSTEKATVEAADAAGSWISHTSG